MITSLTSNTIFLHVGIAWIGHISSHLNVEDMVSLYYYYALSANSNH